MLGDFTFVPRLIPWTKGLGPFLVILANYFGTSIAMAGQLVAATLVAWRITAPLVGPISDTYGRKPVLLSGFCLWPQDCYAPHCRFLSTLYLF